MVAPGQPLAQPPAGAARTRGASRAFAIATMVNVLGWLAHMTYMYYLAPIALRVAGIEARDAWVFATTAIAMGLVVIPAGRLADRIPRRRVMRAGLLLLALAYGALLVAPRLDLLLAGTVATGVGLGLLFVSFNSYVADILDARERSSAYGRAAALHVLASAAGPFLAALVFRALADDALGLRVNGWLFGATTLVGLGLTWGLPSARQPARPARVPGDWRQGMRAAGPIMLVYLFVGAGYGMTAPYFTVYFLDTLGFANDAWGYLLAAGTVASALGSVVAGELGRRHRQTRLALLGQTSLVAASAVFLLPVASPLLALGFLGRSLFSTTTGPLMAALLMQRADASRRGEAQGFVSLTWNAGWSVGAASGGLLLGLLGGALFPLGGLFALLGVAGGVAMLRAARRSRAGGADL